MGELHHPDRSLDVTTAENVRDLGGYTTTEGRTTQWRRFVRSGDMIALSQEDQKKLVEYGITNVIDLRMAKEYEAQPNAFSGSDRIKFHNHDFWGTRFDDYRSWRKGAAPEQKLADLYCSGLEKSGFVMADIMRTFADSDDVGFVFQCRSGKDRTGMVSAILLTIAGVPRTTVCADFELSAHFLPDSTPTDEDLKKPGAYQKGCNARTMELTLGFLDEQFGSVIDYLLHQGLETSQIERIRAKLLHA